MGHNVDLLYVTALFDLDRVENDGRTIEEYKKWLHQTLSHFPNTIVFHDSCLDTAFKQNFPKVVFHEMQITALPLSAYRVEIGRLCSLFSDSGKEDLVYSNIDYGIVINSKFEFLRLAADFAKEANFIWIDAGVSRFLTPNFQPANLQIRNHGEMSLLFDFKNFVRQSIVKKSSRLDSIAPFGSSQRIIGAVTIYVQGSKIEYVANNYLDLVGSCLRRGLWDTEQIFLSRYICANSVNLVFQIRSNHLQMLRNRSRFGISLAGLFQKYLLFVLR